MAIHTTQRNRPHGGLHKILNDLAALDFGEPMVGLHRRAILHSMRELVLMIESVAPRHQGHGRRTADLAHRIGSAAGLPPDELFDLALAGLLHDIGLLTLPAILLDESSELTPREFAMYQSHPRAGAELLEPISFLRRPALWIAHHHERWDGCGYPYGLRGSFIPRGSRILAVADTFDGFLHSETRSDMTPDIAGALRLLQVIGGTQLDPDYVNSCADIMARLGFTEGATIGPS